MTTYLSPASVNAKATDAVVDVEAISVFTSGLFDSTTNEITVIEGARPLVYRVAGSGFFTDCRYIVTAASLVTFPRVSVVQELSPTLFLVDVRDPVPAADAKIVRANRIYVRVYNVNGCGCSYLYEAVLVGVDGAANVAILRIDETLIFNKDKPCLDKAVFLKWGKSCKYPVGSNVYNVANSEQNVRHFDAGVVRHNRNQDVRFKYYESFDTSISFFSGQIGSPILDANGNVVAVGTGRCSDINFDQITAHTGSDEDPLILSEEKIPGESAGNDYGQGTLLPTDPFLLNGDLNRIKGSQQAVRGLLFGIVQKLAKSISRTFVKADQGKCTKRVEIQADEVGNFFVYRKGFLNMHVELVTTNTWFNHNLSIAPNFGNDLSPTFDVRIPYCAELSGYYVRCLAADSVLASILEPGDVITEIACQKLGECGVGFYTLLWKFKPGDTVRLTYYKTSDDYATAHCVMIRLEEINVDYPLEAITILNAFDSTIINGFDPAPLCGLPGIGWVSGGLGNPGDFETGTEMEGFAVARDDSVLLFTPINQVDYHRTVEGLVIQTRGLQSPATNNVGAFNGGGDGNKFLLEINDDLFNGRLLPTFDRIEVVARKVRPALASSTLLLYVNFQAKVSAGPGFSGPPGGPDRIIVGNIPAVLSSEFSTITFAASDSIWGAAGAPGLNLNNNSIGPPLPLTVIPSNTEMFYGLTGDGGLPAATETAPMALVTGDSGSVDSRTIVIQSFTIFFNDGTPPQKFTFGKPLSLQ